MRPEIRLLAAGLALLCASGAVRAQTPSPIAAIKADRWTEAEAAAAAVADPVAVKLVRYYRMLAQNGASASELAAFIAASPDWPNQAGLERRRQEALITEPDLAVVAAQCAATPPAQPATLLRCAEATTGDTATGFARKAWIAGVPNEAEFLARWGAALTPDDEWARDQRLVWRDAAGAARQRPRLDAKRRALAETANPAQTLARARDLRRSEAWSAAAALWTADAPTAQDLAPDRLAEFWTERSLLIRALLKAGDDANAYAVAAAHGQTGAEQRTDAEFLAGFIALRRLKQPAKAQVHFQTLADISRAAITQGRAHYWLGRTAEALGQDPRPEYLQAARWTTTFYGQLAAVALGDDAARLNARINGLRDPEWNRDTALAFTGHEVVRAATWLVAWGDPARARPFLLRMDELAPNPAERALTAELALKVGLPDMAVFVARRLGRDGIPLPRAGWPQPFEPPPVLDPAASLGIMRQESSFDVAAVSSSGARGLMQLMPPTATAVAKGLGVPPAVPTLTVDPNHNMRLGTAYLKEVLDRFDGALPLAAAAYNAGPHRVDQWLGDNGDPRGGSVHMVDWLELIPFAETRNYVQRVMENVAIYRARADSKAPTFLPQWAR